MELLRTYWFIPIFIFVEVASYVLLMCNAKDNQRNTVRAIEPAPHPSVEPLKGWRLVQLAIILYHFPILAPTAALRKDNSAPGTILFGVTPILYSAVAWYFLRKA